MSVYLAAAYERRLEMLERAADLVRRGVRVTSRWIFGNENIPREMAANQDMADLLMADVLVAFTERIGDDTPRRTGGHNVEFGMALAHAKRIVMVGPPESIFHELPQVERFDTWSEAREALV